MTTAGSGTTSSIVLPRTSMSRGCGAPAPNIRGRGPMHVDAHAASAPRAPLRVERSFRAPPTRVFRAWTDPVQLACWADPEPGDAVPEVDLRIGGRYEIAMRRPDGVVHRVVGTYREIDPPRRLVYTWRWATIPAFPETVVTVEFRARADGGTDLVLVHEGLPDDA